MLISSGIDSKLTAKIFDVTGKMVGEIANNEQLFEGLNEIKFSTENIPNGVYFVTLETSVGKETVKLIVSK